MGNTNSINKINFEDIQFLLNSSEKYILINTLQENEQDCLLPNTISPEKEIAIINSLIRNGTKNIKIVIYGKNCNDDKIYKKYNQLQNIGFYNSYVYTGGLFEWLLLQDIYGEKEFPTTKKELDILRFKSRKILDVPLLEY
jgi:hypothetical protein